MDEKKLLSEEELEKVTGGSGDGTMYVAFLRDMGMRNTEVKIAVELYSEGRIKHDEVEQKLQESGMKLKIAEFSSMDSAKQCYRMFTKYGANVTILKE